MPAPFFGTALVGDGARVAGVDPYGDIVDIRQLGPPGRASVEIPPELQAAGTVPPRSGIVARAPLGRGTLPFWRADSVRQSYLPGTNVLRTTARFGEDWVAVTRRIGGPGAEQADWQKLWAAVAALREHVAPALAPPPRPKPSP